MERFASLAQEISSAVWGFPTVAALLSAGAFFSARLNFFQITHIRLWLSQTFFSLFRPKGKGGSEKGSLTPVQTVCAALAATVGTGNIAGVAAAVSVGGPGAVFWMWVSAFFGMMTSYAENLLGICYRQKGADGEWRGGPMYYIAKGLPERGYGERFSLILSKLYAVFLVLASLGIGNMAQSNSVAVSLKSAAGLDPRVCGAVIAVLALSAISGGMKRIGRVTETLVPVMAGLYIAGCLFVFLSNYRSIPYVFSSIFTNAFALKSAAGAAAGAGVKKCISAGFKRGVFSNEAGLGASVTVSSCSSLKEPARQGMWGIFQVFADTMVICTLTAFVLLSASVNAVSPEEGLKSLSSGVQYVSLSGKSGKIMLTGSEENFVFASGEAGLIKTKKKTHANVLLLRGIFDESGRLSSVSAEEIEGAPLAALAFSQHFGKKAEGILAAAVSLFAFSTVIGWSFYGARGWEYLFGPKSLRAYHILCAAAAFFGCVFSLSVVWSISDIFNALMILPNLFALFSLRRKVAEATESYLVQTRRYG